MVFLPARAFLRRRISCLIRERALRRALFSGPAVVERIRVDSEADKPGYTLRFRNGLALGLDARGLSLSPRAEAPGSAEPFPDDREAAAWMNRIVLRSLLRYLTAPGLDRRQREHAAAAAACLWMAGEARPLAATEAVPASPRLPLSAL